MPTPRPPGLGGLQGEGIAVGFLFFQIGCGWKFPRCRRTPDDHDSPASAVTRLACPRHTPCTGSAPWAGEEGVCEEPLVTELPPRATWGSSSSPSQRGCSPSPGGRDPHHECQPYLLPNSPVSEPSHPPRRSGHNLVSLDTTDTLTVSLLALAQDRPLASSQISSSPHPAGEAAGPTLSTLAPGRKQHTPSQLPRPQAPGDPTHPGGGSEKPGPGVPVCQG